MLSTIPGELLTAIVESLDQCRDINAFARTNRRLYGIFNCFVYNFDAETPQTALDWAISRGQDGTVIKALEAGAKISLDMLMGAIGAGHLSTLRILLEADDSAVHSEGDGGRTPFAVACKDGHTDIVNFFLHTYSVDMEARDINGMTPLSLACVCGQLPVVAALLKTGKVDVESRDTHGHTPLINASAYGHTDIVKRLATIDDININAADVYGIGALHAAIKYKHEKVVKTLLDTNNVDINAKDVWGNAPIGLAMHYSHPGIVKLLLRIENTDLLNVNCYAQTALSAAATEPYFGAEDGVLELLLERNIPLEALDIRGRTALLSAAKTDHLYAVKRLLDSERVDYKRKDKNNRALLELAVFHGARKVVKELLKNDIYQMGKGGDLILTAARKGYSDTLRTLLQEGGLNANTTDNFGRTALHRAALYGRVDMIEILLDSGKVDADLRDNRGYTPFATAAGHRSLERYVMVYAFKLRQIHIDVNSRRNRGGMTPFAEACDNNDVDMAKWLLQNYPVDVNARFLRDSTPLIRAVRFNRSETATLLLNTKGVDINAQDRDGRTALAWAVANGNRELVHSLLAKEDIDPDIRDLHGRAPLARAVERGIKPIVEMLLDTGRVDPTAADRRGLTPMSRALKCRHLIIAEMMKKHYKSSRGLKV